MQDVFVGCSIFNFNFVVVSNKETKNQIDTGFVPGIYNYCDQWCEKCDLSHKCLTHVMGLKFRERGGFKPDRSLGGGDKGLYAQLKVFFKMMKEIMKEIADERGISMKEMCESENLDESFMLRKKGSWPMSDELMALGDKSELVRVGVIYGALGERCLEILYKMFKKEANGDTSRYEKDPDISLVDWYIALIECKLRKAVCDFHASAQECFLLDNEFDAAAKIALIAAERSLLAWKNIQERFPVLKDKIEHIFLVLNQLLKDIEQQFPNARAFLRPGFDK